MPSGRKKKPRMKAGGRGPSGFTVFVIFLVLAVLCITAGFALGRYLLATLGETIGGSAPPVSGGTPGGDTGSTTPGETEGDGDADPGDNGGDSGGTVPAGGGAGSVTCQTSPLTVYGVQIGAFGSKANADRAVLDLAGKDLPGHVLGPSGETTLFRVRTVTLTKREVAETVLARIKIQGYPDCFLTTQTLAASRKTLSGSSTQYLDKAAKGIEVLLNCLRIEGDIWDELRAGTLDRQAASTKVEALIASVRQARDGLSSLSAPPDLVGLGEKVGTQLIAASTNLQALKSYLSGQAAADRLAAESTFIALVDGFARMEQSLGP